MFRNSFSLSTTLFLNRCQYACCYHNLFLFGHHSSDSQMSSHSCGCPLPLFSISYEFRSLMFPDKIIRNHNYNSITNTRTRKQHHDRGCVTRTSFDMASACPRLNRPGSLANSCISFYQLISRCYHH